MKDVYLIGLHLNKQNEQSDTKLQRLRVIARTFPEYKIERSVYCRRRRRLFDYFKKSHLCIIGKFSHLNSVFIIDSALVKICKLCRAKQSNICATDTIFPDSGYCAAIKLRCSGYRIHPVCDGNAVVHYADKRSM